MQMIILGVVGLVLMLGGLLMAVGVAMRAQH
jgi:hypothetical protein